MAIAQPHHASEDTMDPTERTPGEWHVSEHGVPDGIYQAGIYAEGGDGRDIATVKSNATDAAILAAAPQLLDACRHTLAYIGERTSGDAQDVLRAAIATAEGRG